MDCFNYAANRMDCFNYAARLGCDIDITLCCYEGMSNFGNVETLEIMYERGIRFDDHDPACSVAASVGSLPCLKWAYEKGAPVYNVFKESAWNGHLDCLVYAHEHRFDDNEGLSDGLLNIEDKIEMDNWYINAIEAACYTTHLDCVKFLYDNGYTSNVNLCFVAAYGGDLSCLQYVHEIGYELNDQVSLYALECDSVECVQYTYEHGCRWDRRFFALAVKKRAYKCMKYEYHRNPIS